MRSLVLQLATWSMQRVGACMLVSGSVHRRVGMTSGMPGHRCPSSGAAEPALVSFGHEVGRRFSGRSTRFPCNNLGRARNYWQMQRRLAAGPTSRGQLSCESILDADCHWLASSPGQWAVSSRRCSCRICRVEYTSYQVFTGALRSINVLSRRRAKTSSG